MFAVHARYRGASTRRADYVAHIAEALGTLPDIDECVVDGVEEIHAHTRSARATTDVVVALLIAGDWAVSIGVAALSSDVEAAHKLARKVLPASARAGHIVAKVGAPGIDTTEISDDVTAVFFLLNHVFRKRSFQGKQATALVRQGSTQNQAAEELGISRQALSQRLQAAGWTAESVGWQLAVHLLQRAESLS